MIIKFFESVYILFIEMAQYLMIGLFFVGLLHIFMTNAFVQKHLGSGSKYSEIKASLFGVPLPLCSCGVVPTAVFLKNNGASYGAVVSFLISTPQTGVDSIIATYGMMGLAFAIYRPIAAFLSGVAGGLFVNRISKNEDDFILRENKEELENIKCSDSSCGIDHSHQHEIDNTKNNKKNVLVTIKDMFKYAYVQFLDDIVGHFIIGLIISAVINIIIPNDFFTGTIFNSGILSIIIMIVVGIPMYVCSTGSIPIALMLLAKGISPGAAFAFLFAGPVTNAASIAVISKSLGKKITTWYIAVVAVLAVVFGLVFNWISKISGVMLDIQKAMHQHEEGFTKIEILSGIVLLALIVYIYIRKLMNKNMKSKDNKQSNIENLDKDDDMNKEKMTITIEGMTCSHCVQHVEDAIKSINEVVDVDVNLHKGEANVIASNDIKSDVIKVINDAGYKAN